MVLNLRGEESEESSAPTESAGQSGPPEKGPGQLPEVHWVLVLFAGLIGILLAIVASRLYDGGGYTVILCVTFGLWAMAMAAYKDEPSDGVQSVPSRGKRVITGVGVFAIVAVPVMLVLAIYDGLTTTPEETTERCRQTVAEYLEAEAELARTIQSRDRAWSELAASEQAAFETGIMGGLAALLGGDAGQARRNQTRAELDVLKKGWDAGLLDGAAEVQQTALGRLARDIVEDCTAAGLWPPPDAAQADGLP